jgi:hypothetical protein
MEFRAASGNLFQRESVHRHLSGNESIDRKSDSSIFIIQFSSLTPELTGEQLRLMIKEKLIASPVE